MPDTEVPGVSDLEVSKVAFKAPPFWKANPELWFLQLESQFYASGISVDTTKFHCVVAVLEGELLPVVSDILRSPPREDKYGVLKQRIINHYAESEASKLKLLLKDLDLGDRRPTHLLRTMQDLAGKSIGNEMLRSLFLQRLPVAVQQILSVCDETSAETTSGDLVKMAERADRILEVTQAGLNLDSVDQGVNVNSRLRNIETKLNSLADSVKRLERATFKSNSKGAEYHRSGSLTKERGSRYRSPLNVEQPECWYHTKFKAKAHKCIPPCFFLEKQGN